MAAPAVATSDSTDLPRSPSNPRLSVPNILALASGPPATSSSGSSDPSSPLTGAKFYHVFVDVRAFVANPCAPGETAELHFSLFSKTDARYLTEEYCVILDHNGVPAREAEGRFGRTKTLFRDLSQHDIQDQIFLVCRIVKNGAIKLSVPSATGTGLPSSTSKGHLAAPSHARSETASFDSCISTTGVDFGLGTSSGMLTTDRSGRQSYRRPFGCAVLEISQFNKVAADPSEQAATAPREHQMPIFVPASESSFATIHEDIIASRIREIEKSPRAEHVAVNVRVLYGEAAELVKDNPSLLTDVTLTQRLGFPDVTFPGDTRNEVFLKLWSGDFSSGGTPRTGRGLAQLAASTGNKNIEVTAEVRMKDGAMVDRVISRGAGELPVTTYHSVVFRGNNTPSEILLFPPLGLVDHLADFFGSVGRARQARDPDRDYGAVPHLLHLPFSRVQGPRDHLWWSGEAFCLRLLSPLPRQRRLRPRRLALARPVPLRAQLRHAPILLPGAPDHRRRSDTQPPTVDRQDPRPAPRHHGRPQLPRLDSLHPERDAPQAPSVGDDTPPRPRRSQRRLDQAPVGLFLLLLLCARHVLTFLRNPDSAAKSRSASFYGAPSVLKHIFSSNLTHV